MATLASSHRVVGFIVAPFHDMRDVRSSATSHMPSRHALALETLVSSTCPVPQRDRGNDSFVTRCASAAALGTIAGAATELDKCWLPSGSRTRRGL